MKKELTQHAPAYFILCLGLIVCTLAFLATWPDHISQRLVIVGISLFYFLWGTITHLKTQRISRQVVTEYFAISVLAGFLLFLLTI